VRVEYDRDAPFSAYRTFAFAEPLGTDRAEGPGSLSRFLIAATRRELESRGLHQDQASPDVRVNFNAQLAQKPRAPQVPLPPGGYYGYRHGVYSTWGTYPWGGADAPYAEGSLNIDVVDVARKQLVWEGVVVGVISDQALADPRPAVDAAVGAAFARYPTRPTK
jgi:hypothetical protein